MGWGRKVKRLAGSLCEGRYSGALGAGPVLGGTGLGCLEIKGLVCHGGESGEFYVYSQGLGQGGHLRAPGRHRGHQSNIPKGRERTDQSRALWGGEVEDSPIGVSPVYWGGTGSRHPLALCSYLLQIQ